MEVKSNCEVQYWLYAAGEESRLWNEFKESKLIGIGWDELGNLNDFSRRDLITSKMKEIWGKDKNYVAASLATWEFSHVMNVGDIIYVKKGRSTIIGRGVVESDYYFDESRKEYKHLRKINWTHDKEFDWDYNAPIKTLTNISQYTSKVDKLNSFYEIEEAEEFGNEKVYPIYGKKYFLDDVFISEDKYETIVNLLKRKKNIILQGAPGVGKTFAAKRIAYSILKAQDTSRVKLVQFHQSYSYEDFIMGYRPADEEGKQFEKKPGVFYEFCKKAQDDSDNDYFFIIDEINRGNMSKIFGELLMLIEKDKRDESLQLLYSNEQFSIPSNLYIIGMMNTADRSLAIIDYALRRRFAFIDFDPAFDSTGFKKKQEEINNDNYNSIIEVIKELNNHIESDASLGKGFRIGHSYFVPGKDETVNDDWLKDIIKYEIEPLLEEYWFDNPDEIKTWTNKLLAVIK